MSHRHAPSYYAATATLYSRFPTLEGAHQADLCVIGAGFTGLATAYYAARRGLSVIVLEARQIGWGASGRNGGQMINGWRQPLSQLARRYGDDQARELMQWNDEAFAAMRTIIHDQAIACDTKKGHLYAAARARDIQELEDEVTTLDRLGCAHALKFLDAKAMQAHIGTGRYHGALHDAAGGHLHPLNYCIGLAQACAKLGVHVYEKSAATKISSVGQNEIIDCPQGRVKATSLMLACDSYIGGLEPRIARHIMPVGNYQIATEPLSEGEARALLPTDCAVSDSKFVLDYYRLTADRRLLFSGGERYSSRQPRDIASFVRPHLDRVFPQLAGKQIDFAWGGLVSVTTSRLPHVGNIGRRYFAHGYSGQGVVLSTLAGLLVAEALAGDARRFNRFAALAPLAFPGGTMLRWPLYAAGMAWYALRDRL